MAEQSAHALWEFESTEFGQVSLKAGEVVMISDEQDDGWATVEKKNGETGFAPLNYLEKGKGKKKGTLFGRKKGSSEPAPPVPAFGSSSSSKKEPSKTGTRRFATARRGGMGTAAPQTLEELGARYEEGTNSPRAAAEAEASPPAAEPENPAVPAKPEISPIPVAKAQPRPVSAGPSGGPGGNPGPRKKVGKLNNPWEAKVAPKKKYGPKKGGPKKIVVKAKRQGDSMRVGPTSPPPPSPGARNGARAGTVLSQSTPQMGTVTTRPSSATVRATDVKETQPAEVPEETLEELKKMNDKRTNITREIYETEKSYVRNLKEVVSLYMEPMKETKWKDHITRLFSNIHLIVTINDELLTGLGETIESWNTETSKVGPIFQKMAPFMRLYNTYGNSYNDALSLLAQLKSKTDFTDWLQQQRGTQPLDLEALLIQPVQRIPRYRLLLEDLLKNTPSRHPDREYVETSLKHIQEVATNVNESIRATEQAKKIGEQTGLQKYIAPHRKLLNEQFFSAKVMLLPRDKVKGAIDVACYLFNDLLVMFFSKPVRLKSNCRHDFTELAWPHTLMWVALDGKTSFKVVGPGCQIIFTSKEKDNTAGANQVAGFHQRLVDVCSSDIPESSANKLKKPEPRTPGTNFGVFEFAEGVKYWGEWKDGLPHGQGTRLYVGGLKVEGSFKEGQKDGDCVITYPTGEVYTGTFTKDEQHGVGQIVWPNGDTYKGYWLGGRRDGDGTFTCAHYRYIGSWSDGLMDGQGKLLFNAGGQYEGKFKEGKFNGEGHFVHANGRRTKGVWSNGVLEGEGEEFYPESSPFKSYTGTFRNDVRDGNGTMFYRDGSQYKGDWKEGQRHGRGILTCPQRPIMRYEGFWARDKFDGKGEVFFSTKDRYIGSFAGGHMHGPGTYFYANGVQLSGEWKQGIRQRKTGLVRQDASTGERFELEVTGFKDRWELGEAKYNGKLLSYFITPSRPELEQSMLETEVVGESTCNLLTGSGAPLENPAIKEEPTTDSPSLSARVGGEKRRSSFMSSLKRNK